MDGYDADPVFEKVVEIGDNVSGTFPDPGITEKMGPGYATEYLQYLLERGKLVSVDTNKMERMSGTQFLSRTAELRDTLVMVIRCLGGGDLRATELLHL